MLQFHDVTVFGEALETFGFEAYGAIDGFGLMSFGMLWQCGDIWTASDSTLTTSWSASETVITTIWSNTDASITTIWSESAGGIQGEC